MEKTNVETMYFTRMERKLIRVMDTFQYWDNRKPSDNGVWSWSFVDDACEALGKTGRSVRGTMTGLVKKGMIEVYGSGEEREVRPTELYDEWYAKVKLIEDYEGDQKLYVCTKCLATEEGSDDRYEFENQSGWGKVAVAADENNKLIYEDRCKHCFKQNLVATI